MQKQWSKKKGPKVRKHGVTVFGQARVRTGGAGYKFVPLVLLIQPRAGVGGTLVQSRISLLHSRSTTINLKLFWGLDTWGNCLSPETRCTRPWRAALTHCAAHTPRVGRVVFLVFLPRHAYFWSLCFGKGCQTDYPQLPGFM